MTQEQWKCAWSAYAEASDLFGEDLEAWLRARNLPENVEAEVWALLADRETPGPKLSSEEASGDQRRVGLYRLLDTLGQGAMGTVYRAEQERPLRRVAALKIVRPGLHSGETAAGQRYFVMEFVPGVPITTYCDQGSLAVRQRLELVMEVCQAIQHAHQKGIIHRDIKPSNVLVHTVDGRPGRPRPAAIVFRSNDGPPYVSIRSTSGCARRQAVAHRSEH